MLRTGALPAGARGGLRALDLEIGQLWQIAALALAFIVTLGASSFGTDTWWALKMGQLSVQTGGPSNEVLAFGPSVAEAANGQWLAQEALYLVYQGSGEAGLRLLAGLLIVGSMGMVLAAARVSGAGPRTAVLGALLAILLAVSMVNVRSQLFSYLLFALTSLLLQVRGRHPRLLYALPPLFALWANLHGAFALGLALVALYAAGEAWELASARRPGWPREGAMNCAPTDPSARARAGRWAVVLIGCGAATLANPLGPSVYSYFLAATTHPTARALVSEWQPVTIADPFGQAVAICGLVFFMVLRASRRPMAAVEILVLLVFGYLALSSLRNVAWLGLVLAPIVARHAASIQPPAWLSRGLSSGSAARSERAPLGLLVAGLISLWAGLSPFWLPSVLGDTPGAKAASGYAPHQAADFLARLPAGSRLYNYQPWSGYLAWRLWPAQQPIVDVRFEAHPPALWNDYVAVSLSRADWASILDRYGVDYLVLSAGEQSQLVALAEASGRWGKLYEDESAVVLGRP